MSEGMIEGSSGRSGTTAIRTIVIYTDSDSHTSYAITTGDYRHLNNVIVNTEFSDKEDELVVLIYRLEGVPIREDGEYMHDVDSKLAAEFSTDFTKIPGLIKDSNFETHLIYVGWL